MADRWAVANGNWSNTATWNGGTLPTSADDVYANNFTVTIDQNVTVLSIRTESATGINVGGGFVLNAGITLNADVRVGAVSNHTCLTCNYPSPGSSTINGTIYGSTAASGSANQAVLHNNSGTLTVNGNIFAGQFTGSGVTNRMGLFNTSSGTTNVNGNIYGSQLVTSSDHHGLRSTGTAIINVVGNVYGGKAPSSPGVSIAGGTYNQTGGLFVDAVSANSNNALSISNGTLNILNGSSLNYAGGTSTNVISITGNTVYSITASFVCTGTSNGGYISSSTSGTGTITSSTGSITNGTTASLQSNMITHSGSGNLTINADLNRTGSGCLLNISGTGAQLVTVNGNIFTSGGGGQHIVQFSRTGGTLTVNGNCSGPTFGTNNQSCVFSSASNTIIVNGNAVGGSFSGVQNAGVYLSTTGATCTVNGSAIGGSGSNASGVYLVSGCTATIRRAIGNAYGAGSVGLVSTPGVIGAQGATVNVQEFECGSRGQFPISSDCRIQLTPNSVFILKDASGNDVTLVNPASVVTPPAVTDVRSGVVYNAGNLTGTCAVPAANSVAAGVAVGNTVGTAVLTQANVWDYALSSASSVAGSVGEKLKKTAIPADIIALG